MPIRPETHRAAGLARRDALLRAAVEVVAERGVAGATHREIARRADVPPSTTSYFFASIDDLVLEALRTFAAQQVAQLEAVTAAVASEDITFDALADRIAATLVGTPAAMDVAQFEAYLEATRRPELRPEVAQVLGAFEDLAEASLRAAGASRAREGARAFVALADGFSLHRLARPLGEADLRALRDAMRALFIAYAMDDGERAAWDERLAGRPEAPG
jgi:DNA-binding transcriptional regulator YbjK